MHRRPAPHHTARPKRPLHHPIQHPQGAPKAPQKLNLPIALALLFTAASSSVISVLITDRIYRPKILELNANLERLQNDKEKIDRKLKATINAGIGQGMSAEETSELKLSMLNQRLAITMDQMKIITKEIDRIKENMRQPTSQKQTDHSHNQNTNTQ